MATPDVASSGVVSRSGRSRNFDSSARPEAHRVSPTAGIADGVADIQGIKGGGEITRVCRIQPDHLTIQVAVTRDFGAGQYARAGEQAEFDIGAILVLTVDLLH